MKVETKASFQGKEINLNKAKFTYKDLPTRYDGYRLDNLELKFTFTSMEDLEDFKQFLAGDQLNRFISVHEKCFWPADRKINIGKIAQPIFVDQQPMRNAYKTANIDDKDELAYKREMTTINRVAQLEEQLFNFKVSTCAAFFCVVVMMILIMVNNG